MSCQKEKFNFIDGVDEKGEPARDCRRGCSHTLQEVPFFFFRDNGERNTRAWEWLPDARKVTRGGRENCQFSTGLAYFARSSMPAENNVPRLALNSFL